MSYYYKVYGLNVESEILVPELSILSKEEQSDIHIKISYGIMPEDIKVSINNGQRSKYERNRMWFYINNVATFYIYDGKNIVIEPCEITDPQLVKVYILGSVLGMVMLQRNIVAIHGGSIVIDNKGYIFTGDKGAGKSTLTTALRKKGYGFVSDDVGAIKTGEINKIHPGFGYQKLCEDALVNLGYDPAKYEPFRGDFNIKYIVPALEDFVSTAVPFEGMFELEVGDVDCVQVEEIKGNDKLKGMIKNIFRIEILRCSGGMSGEYFKKCIDIAKDLKYYKITRPKGQFTVDEQIDIIEKIIIK